MTKERSSIVSRMHFNALRAKFADDKEMNDVFDSYQSERNNIEPYQ